ncbi:MAG: hypothetical protein H0X66_07355 [Verrucomicrobia bacterium]|nr:hypothetical protein [Verrucomicrobiota bacterium]
MRKTFSIRNPLIKSGVSAFALTLFLFVHLLSWSSSLHHEFHEEADHEDHQCAVTLLQNGQVDVPQIATDLVPVTITFTEVMPPEVSFVSSPAYLIPHGRGPPSLA